MHRIESAPSFYQNQLEKKSISKNRITKIAQHAFAEFITGALLITSCIPFFSLASCAIPMILSSAIVSIYNASIEWATKDQKCLSSVIKTTKFYQNSASQTMTLIHEVGHYSTARMLFKGTPKITLIPYGGGWTSYSSRFLSSIGMKLGYRRSIFLITLAGPFLALLVASILLVTGVIFRENLPKLSPYLIGIGVLESLRHARYAISALWTPKSRIEHDFVRLRTFGIHPINATIFCLLLPTIIGIYYTIINSNFKKTKKPQNRIIINN